MLEKLLNFAGAMFGAGAQMASEAATGVKDGVRWTWETVCATIMMVIVIVVVTIGSVFFGIFAATRIFGDTALGVIAVLFAVIIGGIGITIGVLDRKKKHRKALVFLEMGAIALFVLSVAEYCIFPAVLRTFSGAVEHGKAAMEDYNRQERRQAAHMRAPRLTTCSEPYSVNGEPQYYVSEFDPTTCYDSAGDDPGHPGAQLKPLDHAHQKYIDLIKLQQEHEAILVATASPSPTPQTQVAAATPSPTKQYQFKTPVLAEVLDRDPYDPPSHDR